MSVKQLLILPHIKVINANAWSSPYTAGFPSVCAFGGAVHALQRKLNEKGFTSLNISSFGVICHKFTMRTYREGNFGDLSIVAGANPLDKDGERPSFVPEIKCQMEISLLCELDCSSDAAEQLSQVSGQILNSGFRIAAGDVVSSGTPFTAKAGTREDDADFRRYLIRKLMPGYALIERRELMVNSMQDGHDALDALLDCLAVHTEVNPDNGEIKRSRTEKGWLVPISTGYAAISDIGRAVNQRDASTPHRFAEAVVTLGEFRMLHRLKSLELLLWQGSYDKDSGLDCYQQQTASIKDTDTDFDLMQI
ncbi:MAG TPA: type I-F CRISPR-associated protein Csy2 [Succinivibrionaceae bacterium]|nr:type I-F CRISPR-associated protein Csy2 [Succinivibrionaceae bacterium]